ncbi:MAG: hypothetical protein LBT14_07805 [Treponema sp.]|nr:hypothetical protein [Treponema sp.]
MIDNHLLVFVKGTSIRLSPDGAYLPTFKLFDANLYDGAVAGININSVDLIGNLTTQTAKGIHADNRLNKAHHGMKAIARAAQAAKSCQGRRSRRRR